MFKKASWFFFLGCLAISCLDEPDCYQLNNNVVVLSFRSFTDFTPLTVNFDAIRAIGSDSVFYEASSGSKVPLPLNFYHDSTLYTFDHDHVLDSLLLGYSAKAQFVSPDCGERFVLDDLTILKHTFDSVRLVSKTPTKAGNGIQIEIYN